RASAGKRSPRRSPVRAERKAQAGAHRFAEGADARDQLPPRAHEPVAQRQSHQGICRGDSQRREDAPAATAAIEFPREFRPPVRKLVPPMRSLAFLFPYSLLLFSSLAGSINIAPEISAGLGVNIHFTDPKPNEMEQLAAGGFEFVRMDFSWNATE